MILLKSNFYGKIFAKRSAVSFLLIAVLMLSCVVRVAVVATSGYSEVQAEQSSYRIEIAKLRGTIYDCNMVPITNNTYKTVAAVSPTPKGIMAISSCAEEVELKNTLETLKNNMPTVCTVKNTISGEGIAFSKVYEHTAENLSACHLIGYTDSSGHGVSGLELAYDDFLYSDKKVSAVFTTNAIGDVLGGIEPYFENDLSVVNSGIVTTLDINIQNIAEISASKMNSGCVIVADVNNSKIRAMASVPTFDIDNIAESLQNENSPMLNRALSAYSVGSVFKPCVAAAAIEAKKSDVVFCCEGSMKIVDRVFRCHKLSGHGEMNLCDALAQSCNCFFYNFAINLGGKSIYNMASSLNFGSKIKIADNFYTAEGSIPDLKTLDNEGTLANLSIGQGDVLLTPVSMLTLYLSIAGDGCYYLPSVIEKTVKNGVETVYDSSQKTRVMSSETAATLRNYLQKVITDGTGTDAVLKYTTAAGKTATAQTGRYYKNGTEITNSWFCGFFPAEQPQYVVIVMSDGKSDVSTASVFAEVSNGICELKDLKFENNS